MLCLYSEDQAWPLYTRYQANARPPQRKSLSIQHTVSTVAASEFTQYSHVAISGCFPIIRPSSHRSLLRGCSLRKKGSHEGGYFTLHITASAPIERTSAGRRYELIHCVANASLLMTSLSSLLLCLPFPRIVSRVSDADEEVPFLPFIYFVCTDRTILAGLSSQRSLAIALLHFRLKRCCLSSLICPTPQVCAHYAECVNCSTSLPRTTRYGCRYATRRGRIPRGI